MSLAVSFPASSFFRAQWLLLLCLELLEEIVEAEEGLFPELAIALEPLRRLGQRLGFEAARAALRVGGVGDEAGALEHLEMLGDGGLAHGERLRELGHRRVAGREAGEDGAARGIGEGGEGGIEPRGVLCP